MSGIKFEADEVKDFTPFEYEKELEAVATSELKEEMPEILPEPETDGPIALMDRGWEIINDAHEGNITLALRSWIVEARQWREDCHAWAEANPTADN